MDDAEQGASLSRDVRLRFTTEVGGPLLEPAHLFLAAFAAARYRPALASRLSLAAHELLANALAYGSLSGEVVFELADRGSAVELRVWNDAVASRIDMLCDRVAKLRVDPQAVFIDEMRRYVAQGISRAMLGLARVRHEAAMELEVHVNGSRVLVIATAAR